jgi:hypothetical protein
VIFAVVLVAHAAAAARGGGGRIITFTDWVAASAGHAKGYLAYYVGAGVKAMTEGWRSS